MNNYLVNDNIEDVYRLMPLQKGMFFHNEIDNRSYILQKVLVVNGKPDIELLKKAIELLTLRYEVFRTSFLKSDDIYQVVYKKKNVDFSFKKISEKSEIYKEADLILEHGIDLENDSLMKTVLFSLNDEEYFILFSVHHIIIDGWSIGLVLKSLEYYYKQLIDGVPLEELIDEIDFEKEVSATYGDFISYVDGIDHDEALQYCELPPIKHHKNI